MSEQNSNVQQSSQQAESDFKKNFPQFLGQLLMTYSSKSDKEIANFMTGYINQYLPKEISVKKQSEINFLQKKREQEKPEESYKKSKNQTNYFKIEEVK